MIPLATGIDEFVQATATFFVQSWMSSVLPRMLHVWQHWSSAPEEDRRDYISYLDPALLSGGSLRDDPVAHYTKPIAAFSETMLRWLRQSFDPAPLLIEPPVPCPPGDGMVDMVEVTGFPGNYASIVVTL